MTVPNPLLSFTESEFTKGVFNNQVWEVKIVGDEDTDFIIFGPRGDVHSLMQPCKEFSLMTNKGKNRI